jgi:hypothetical protein
MGAIFLEGSLAKTLSWLPKKLSGFHGLSVLFVLFEVLS